MNKLLFLSFVLLLSFGCKNKSNSVLKVELFYPKNGAVIRWGEEKELKWKGDLSAIDSFIVVSGESRVSSKTLNFPIVFDKETPIGYKKVLFEVYSDGQKSKTISLKLLLLSNEEEEQGVYEVVNVFPHDNEAYTQGLEFHKGKLYEGTGLYGESSLREVSLQTGEVAQKINLADRYFGEGITFLNNKLFQLTWQEHTCFVYDENTLEKINEFKYPLNMEGWGLTHLNGELVMSSGDESLYFLSPETFQLNRKIDVFNYRGQAVSLINELENVNGKILANIYQSNLIVEIDPATGRLIKVYDMKGLLTKEDYKNNDRIDVLNGIAFQPETNQLFITGKNWPKMFEVKLK